MQRRVAFDAGDGVAFEAFLVEEHVNYFVCGWMLVEVWEWHLLRLAGAVHQIRGRDGSVEMYAHAQFPFRAAS